MTKYVVTNGKGEYLGRDPQDDLDFGADRKRARQFDDFDRAYGMALLGNMSNILAYTPDWKTHPYRVEEVESDE